MRSFCETFAGTAEKGDFFALKPTHLLGRRQQNKRKESSRRESSARELAKEEQSPSETVRFPAVHQNF